MRIAQCNESFLPIIDGVGRVTYEYATALGERGHESYVISPMSQAGYRQNYPFEILDFVSVPLPGTAKYRTGVATLDRHYMARIEQVRLDILHAHSPGFAGMEAIRLAEKLHIPLIGTFHTRYYDDIYRVTHSESLTSLGLKYIVDFYDRCDEVWAVSKFAAEELKSYGYKGEIEIVPHGTRTPLITDSDAEEAHSAFALDKRPLLLYVGQIDWKKNLLLSLNAMARLKAMGVEFQFVLAGKGGDMGAVEKKAEELGLQAHVRLVGHVTDTNLLNGLYRCASLLVFPSSYDTAGLVVREAAAAGVPSVVLRGSAPAECIVDGETGYLCAETPESLAETIALALHDREKLEWVSAQANQRIPVPWDTIIDEVERRYRVLAGVDARTLKRKRGLFRKELDAMDKTLEKRKVTLMWNFIKQDMQNIYAYPYTQQTALPKNAVRTSTRLPEATPESQGVHSRDLLALYHTVDADITAGVQQMMVLRHGRLIAEGSWAPYTTALPHQLYSMSKSIVSTAIGMLADEGRLQLSERLVDLFADKVKNPAEHPMKEITVWHLLTMSSGVRYDEMGSALGEDWEQEFLDSGVRFAAGTQFYYNSMNTYMLAAIVCRITGGTLMEYLRPRLFEPLGIENASWEVCPHGIEKGGWGLSITLGDSMKIGQLYLQKGVWEVEGTPRQLVSRAWIEAATSRQINTPNGEMRNGYGYQIWMAPEEGSYLFNGAFGQYLIMLPAQDAVVGVYSGTAQLFAQGDIMLYVHRCVDSMQDAPLPENDAERRMLLGALENLSLLDHQSLLDTSAMPLSLRWIARHLDGAAYVCEQNVSGLMPLVLQSVHNNFSPGIAKFAFHLTPEGDIRMDWEEDGRTLELFVPTEGVSRTRIPFRNDAFEVAVSASAGLSKEGDPLLRLYVYFIETPSTRIITLRFHGDQVSLLFDENPSIQGAMSMLMELSGTTRFEVYRTLMPFLKRDKLQTRLRSMAVSKVEATRATAE